MASLWQEFRTACRTSLTTAYGSLIGVSVPVVYTNEPRNRAALPFAVIERVSEIEDQSFADTDRVKILDFQVRIVSLGSGSRPATNHETLCEATEVAVRRQKYTLSNWTVSKINYQQTMTVQETDDAIVSVLEFTVIGHPSA
jgi:hypothetical protein